MYHKKSVPVASCMLSSARLGVGYAAYLHSGGGFYILGSYPDSYALLSRFVMLIHQLFL